MKRLLADTNVILDLLANRKPWWHDAARLFAEAERQNLKLLVSAISFNNIHYILRKQIPSQHVRNILQKLLLIVEVLPLDQRTISLSLNDFLFRDFEEALQYYTAIEHDIDVIITRNIQDFKSSNIPVMSPHEFLTMI
jgi:predicted nucleic acid-binding protein